MAFCGKPGKWQVVRVPLDGKLGYWTGTVDLNDGLAWCTFDPALAAQFRSKESADFAVAMMGGSLKYYAPEEIVFVVR